MPNITDPYMDATKRGVAPNKSRPAPKGNKNTGGGGSRSASGGGGGGGSHGGSGGGGMASGGVGKVRGLEMYRVGKFNPGKIRQSAQAQAKMQTDETLRQNESARGQSRLSYINAIRDLQDTQGRATGQANTQSGEERGRMNNMLMNRNMGYGGGAANNVESVMRRYADMIGGINADYARGERSQLDTLTQAMNDMAEADRVARANQGGLERTIYQALLGDAWDRYYQRQQLALDAAAQRNSARETMQKPYRY